MALGRATPHTIIDGNEVICFPRHSWAGRVVTSGEERHKLGFVERCEGLVGAAREKGSNRSVARRLYERRRGMYAHLFLVAGHYETSARLTRRQALQSVVLTETSYGRAHVEHVL